MKSLEGKGEKRESVTDGLSVSFVSKLLYAYTLRGKESTLVESRLVR
jgi:hypothetical protein